MEQVIKAYGKFLLEGIILVALLTILTVMSDSAGNKGVFSIVGTKLEMNSVDYNQYNDFKGTYKSESNKEAPVISVIGTHLYSGVCSIPSFIKATDYTGAELLIMVSSIKDAGGTELIGDYNQDTGEISLASGIYMVEVSAKDVNNKLTKCTVQIPVSN